MRFHFGRSSARSRASWRIAIQRASRCSLPVALPPPLRQLAGLQRRPHRAARLGVVRAVAEPALLGQLLDVGEHQVQRLRRRRSARRCAGPGCPRPGRRRAAAPARGAPWCGGPCRRRAAPGSASRPRRRARWSASTCRRRTGRAAPASGPATTCARTASSPSPVVALTVSTSTPGAAAATSARQLVGVGHQVGLGQHDQRASHRSPRPARGSARSGRGPARGAAPRRRRRGRRWWRAPGRARCRA